MNVKMLDITSQEEKFGALEMFSDHIEIPGWRVSPICLLLQEAELWFTHMQMCFCPYYLEMVKNNIELGKEAISYFSLCNRSLFRDNMIPGYKVKQDGSLSLYKIRESWLVIPSQIMWYFVLPIFHGS